MSSSLALAAGFAAGIVAGALLWNFVRAARISGLREQLAAERATREKIQSDFKAAASEALQQANQQFLAAAIKDLSLVRQQAGHELDTQKREIHASVGEMKERLEDYQKAIRKFEEERFTLYARMEQSLDKVLHAEEQIRLETSSLKNSLTSSSGVRGRWGERMLLGILERNDFIRGQHFDTQVGIGVESDRELRPDFVIHLPGGKKLVIDAKEAGAEYVLAQETADPEKQKAHYERLVANIRGHLTRLARKEYQQVLDPDVPFVIMFIPSEAAIRAAFVTDPGLFEEANHKRVILASPMTVIPLIYLVKHGWQQQRLAENARELGILVEELGQRLTKFVEHLQGMRQGIKRTVESWDGVVGSWQKRVAPQIEKIRSLGGRLRDTEELEALDSAPRALESKDPETPA